MASSGSCKESKRSKIPSKTSTAYQTLSSFPHSSKGGHQDRKSSCDKAFDFPASNQTSNSFDVALLNEEHPADLSMVHFPHRRQHDLLGLELQTSCIFLSNYEEHTSKEVIEVIPHDPEQILTQPCPFHKALLEAIQSNMDAQPGDTRELKHIPMERYLTEDLAERYALFSLGPTKEGEGWARYSGCICMPN